MKKSVIVFITAALLGIAGASWAAAPAGWDNVQMTSVVMGMLGKVTVDGVPFKTDNASILAVFADNLTTPVGVYRFASDSGVDNTGRYGIMAVYGLDNQTAGAVDNTLLRFALYNASNGAVLTNPAVKNYGNIFDNTLPYLDNTTVRFSAVGGPSMIDNVTLAFTTPASDDSENWFKKTFGCSAAGGRGPEPLDGAFTLLLMLAPAFLLRQIRRRRRQGSLD